MLTNLFESRNKTFLNLVKLGDYLGRSLRENIELFSVEDNVVTYLTESGAVISGEFDNLALRLTNIKVEDIKLFEDKDLYSKVVDKKVSSFLADILENDLDKVQESFDSILDVWTTRLQFDRVKTRLTEKVQKFNDGLRITSTPEFARLVELKPELVKFLKESKNIVSIPEIRNTIKLSSVISSSFGIPKLDIKSIQESGSYQIPVVVNHTLYDHLCKQELVAKELVEAKENFDGIWAHNEKVQKLPSFIYESEDNIAKLVAEIVTDVPYFAMATKKQLTSLVESNLDLLATNDAVPAKDIKDFVSKIFEFKKPVKNYLLNVLNEKYGINVQNLTDQPTFNSLIKTQIVIFESLSKLSPKNSILKKTLNEFSELLKVKTGIESIDVSDFLNEVFKSANYSKALNETSLMSYLDFNRVADDLGKIGAVLKMIQSGMGGQAGGGATPGSGMPMPQPAMGGMQSAEGMPDPALAGGGQMEPDGGELAGMGGGEGEGLNPQGDAQDIANDVNMETAVEDGEGGNPMDMDGPDMGDPMANPMGDEPEAVEQMPEDQLIDHLKELDGLIASLKSELGVEGGEEEGMGDMPPEEGDMPPMEGEEGAMGDDDGGPTREVDLDTGEMGPEDGEGGGDNDGDEGDAPVEDSDDDGDEKKPEKKFDKKPKK